MGGRGSWETDDEDAVSTDKGEDGDDRAGQIADLAGAMLPWAATSGFIQYGQLLRRSPLDKAGLEAHKGLVSAVWELTGGSLSQSVAKAAMLKVTEAKQFCLGPQDREDCAVTLAKRLRTMLCHVGRVGPTTWLEKNKPGDCTPKRPAAKAACKRPAAGSTPKKDDVKRRAGGASEAAVQPTKTEIEEDSTMAMPDTFLLDSIGNGSCAHGAAKQAAAQASSTASASSASPPAATWIVKYDRALGKAWRQCGSGPREYSSEFRADDGMVVAVFGGQEMRVAGLVADDLEELLKATGRRHSKSASRQASMWKGSKDGKAMRVSLLHSPKEEKASVQIQEKPPKWKQLVQVLVNDKCSAEKAVKIAEQLADAYVAGRCSDAGEFRTMRDDMLRQA